MVVFGLTLRWFPIRGFGEDFFGHLHHMFLPALTMALFLAPILIQSLRSSILDVLEADYIEVARAKGLSPRRIMLKHILRNAAIPVITVLAVNIGWLLSGAVIVETVFTIHGLGSQLVRSVGFRDYFTVQGLALVFSVLVHDRQSRRRSRLYGDRPASGAGLTAMADSANRRASQPAIGRELGAGRRA